MDPNNDPYIYIYVYIYLCHSPPTRILPLSHYPSISKTLKCPLNTMVASISSTALKLPQTLNPNLKILVPKTPWHVLFISFSISPPPLKQQQASAVELPRSPWDVHGAPCRQALRNGFSCWWPMSRTRRHRTNNETTIGFRV